MSFVGGVPIESLIDAAQDVRDRVMTLLFAPLLREVFEFRLVQTDPNFANCRYDPDSGQLILLDFGATRPYKAAIGYFDESTQDRHRQAILDMGEQAFALLPSGWLRLRRDRPASADSRSRHGAGQGAGILATAASRCHAVATQVRWPVPSGHPPQGAGRPARVGAVRLGVRPAGIECIEVARCQTWHGTLY